MDDSNDWTEGAVCRQIGSALWFAELPFDPEDPEGTTIQAQTERAKSICNNECPVRLRCLMEALAAEGAATVYGRHGIWGGTDPKQRLRISKRKAQRAARAAAKESRLRERSGLNVEAMVS